MNDAITDVDGIEVGHASDHEARTGCTVVVCRAGAVAGVAVRGGAPGTRETDLCRPGTLIERVHAVVLTGGSAFGLDAAGGVMRSLALGLAVAGPLAAATSDGLVLIVFGALVVAGKVALAASRPIRTLDQSRAILELRPQDEERQLSRI